MHTLYFVVLPKEKARNSIAARKISKDWLMEEGFCTQGFFLKPRSDWFSIGGRWSGILERVSIRDRDTSIFQESDVTRDLLQENGKISDAKELTSELYRLMKFTELKDVQVLDIWRKKETRLYDLDTNCLDDSWIVVIDYHS